jgi:hypothetical protein
MESLAFRRGWLKPFTVRCCELCQVSCRRIVLATSQKEPSRKQIFVDFVRFVAQSQDHRVFVFFVASVL